ncbi:hypothetical protein [Pelagibius sp. Alg239-R121]|uniref:hypothetical protein n=1 Tax=Pelagibius sp. Alg239-R121 TaxID=2993448 RepID=UPI0024A6BD2A|nr:hypothetical protein [Pelagibius sp. Alg239-R121]
MDLETFKASLEMSSPPEGCSLALQALWHQANGDWDTAHERAQADDSKAGAWVHGHLHRVEGDQSNAAYWYRRAGRDVPATSLREELASIVAALE